MKCPKCGNADLGDISSIIEGDQNYLCCEKCGMHWHAPIAPIVNADPESDHNGPVGQIAAHVSGDEDGPICAWSFNVGDGRIVYCGEISNARFDELDEDAREAFGGEPIGWFLMCYWPDRSEVWAKCAGDDEARRLVILIGSMLYAGSLWRASVDKHAEDIRSMRIEVDKVGGEPMLYRCLDILSEMGIPREIADSATSPTD